MEKYQEEYKEFIENYKSGLVTGERVGEVISRMAQYFTEANLNFASALIAFNIEAKRVEETVDEGSGKMISSSKAKVISDASVQSQTLIVAKSHVENIEQALNALKSLQRGIMAEFANGNL